VYVTNKVGEVLLQSFVVVLASDGWNSVFYKPIPDLQLYS